MSIGNYQFRKGHELLVEAIDLLNTRGKPVKLKIIGRTNKEVCEWASKLPSANLIEFTGPVAFTPMDAASGNDDLMREILADADVYVSSSREENAEDMSLALLEAMAAGLPVVATDISGNRDLVNQWEPGILVAPGTAEALADGIEKMLSDTDLYTRSSGNSIRCARSFDWSAVAEKYVEQYRGEQ